MADNVNALPALPAGSTANNVPSHLDLLKDAINAGSIIRRLSGAAIAALSGVELTAGTVVYNTTTGKLQVSTGAAFVDVLPVGGQASGTTDANGYMNITHGMGTTPTWAVVTIESSGSPRADFAIVNGRSSTIIQIRVFRDGAPLNAGAVNANWLAR